jgi:hypothetical protein
VPEQCPQSLREVAITPTIAMGLRGHNIPTQRCTNVLPRCQLRPCHLEKGKNTLLKLDFLKNILEKGNIGRLHNFIGTTTGATHSLKLRVEEFQSTFSF